jgi:uncharacterized protein (TIGR00375 family)
MEFIADLHIHSKFSRATSGDMIIPKIAEAAEQKGITLVGTGDFTHPAWLEMLRNDLTEQEDGVYKFQNTYFILTVEVNNIYSKNGRLRRIHNIIFTPSFESAEKINKFLAKYGNLNSDGRPLLSLDSKVMLEKILEIDSRNFLIPSHIWTPWFSLFGSKSGFDSIHECFEELSTSIIGLETGLSSDPKMNWTLSSLDKYSLISNSDAHSPSRLGREANVLDCKISYNEIREVFKTKDKNRFLYTIEFFPEEGKYHYDGHRNCNIVLSPQESMANDDICPVCGKQLTIGVAHRVRLLADREDGFVLDNAVPYKNLIPLEEIIAEALDMGRESNTVKNQYLKLVQALGGEFNILLNVPISDITDNSDQRIGYAVELVRAGKVNIAPGYDGVFGKINILSQESNKTSEKNSDAEQSQMKLF